MCRGFVRLAHWPLFATDPRFRLSWSQLRLHPFTPEDDEYYSVVTGGVESARIHLDRRPMTFRDWLGVPDLGLVQRVQLIEVAADIRGRGLGRAIVRSLQARQPDMQLVALSVPEASGFWETLGWSRFEHVTDGDRMPLYIAPHD